MSAGSFVVSLCPKIGHVKMRYHRPLPDGQIKTLTIQRKASGWYANITALKWMTFRKLTSRLLSVLMSGLNHSLPLPKAIRLIKPAPPAPCRRRIKEKTDGISPVVKRAVPASVNKTRYLPNITNTLPTNAVTFHYKTAHHLFSQYDAVVIEGLTIDNMKRNHYLAKSISDAGWGNFRLALESKAANAGKHLLKVAPHGTSQICSGCGVIVKKSLSIRIHSCDCGLTLDRDHNAAINILGAATALRGGTLDYSPERPARERSEKPVSPTDWATSPVPLGRGS